MPARKTAMWSWGNHWNRHIYFCA